MKRYIFPLVVLLLILTAGTVMGTFSDNLRKPVVSEKVLIPDPVLMTSIPEEKVLPVAEKAPEPVKTAIPTLEPEKTNQTANQVLEITPEPAKEVTPEATVMPEPELLCGDLVSNIEPRKVSKGEVINQIKGSKKTLLVTAFKKSGDTQERVNVIDLVKSVYIGYIFNLDIAGDSQLQGESILSLTDGYLMYELDMSPHGFIQIVESDCVYYQYWSK
jgi:hypothetical protein